MLVSRANKRASLKTEHRPRPRPRPRPTVKAIVTTTGTATFKAKTWALAMTTTKPAEAGAATTTALLDPLPSPYNQNVSCFDFIILFSVSLFSYLFRFAGQPRTDASSVWVSWWIGVKLLFLFLRLCCSHCSCCCRPMKDTCIDTRTIYFVAWLSKRRKNCFIFHSTVRVARPEKNRSFAIVLLCTLNPVTFRFFDH